MHYAVQWCCGIHFTFRIMSSIEVEGAFMIRNNSQTLDKKVNL